VNLWEGLAVHFPNEELDGILERVDNESCETYHFVSFDLAVRHANQVVHELIVLKVAMRISIAWSPINECTTHLSAPCSSQ